MNQTDHLVFPAYSFLEAGLVFVCRLLNTHLLWEGVPPALHCPPAPHLPSPFLQTLEEGQKKVEATVLCCTCYLLASTFLPGTLVFHRQLLICRVYSLQPHTHTHTHTHTQTWSVQFSHSVASDSLQLHGMQHSRLPCPSPTPRVDSNSCPSSWWCHPTISSSVIPFSSCFQFSPDIHCSMQVLESLV